uniref:Hexosyltransferase n=1 Tax=Plectus sambesii TaxID=2011161 RepID=A0A914VRG2_9BILA
MIGYFSSTVSVLLLLLFYSCMTIPTVSSKTLKRDLVRHQPSAGGVRGVLARVNTELEHDRTPNHGDIPLPVKFQHIYAEVAVQERLSPEPDEFFEGIDARTENVLLIGERLDADSLRNSFCGGLANKVRSIRDADDSLLSAIVFKPFERVKGTVTKATLSLPTSWIRRHQKMVLALYCIEGLQNLKLETIEIPLNNMERLGMFMETNIDNLADSSFDENRLAVVLDGEWNRDEIEGTAYLMMDTEYVELRHSITHKCNVSLSFEEQPCCLYPFELNRHSHGLRHLLNERLVIHRCRGKPEVAGEGDTTRVPIPSDQMKLLTKSGMSRRLMNPVQRTCTESKYNQTHLFVQMPNGERQLQVLDNLDATECVVLY